MTTSWLPVLSTLVPLAIIVAISPFSIVPAVLLVLHSPRPKSTGVSFAVGWVVGLMAIVIVAAQLPHVFGGLDRPVPLWANWMRIAVGVVLLAAGVWRWLTRTRAVPSARLTTSIGKVSPGGAAVLGLGLTVINTKVLLISVAAGLAIGTSGLGAFGRCTSVVFYAVVAGSTAILPVMAYVLAAERADTWLENAKTWLERHQATLTAVVLVLIGVVLVGTGIRAL